MNNTAQEMYKTTKIAVPEDVKYAQEISDFIEKASKVEGTGIAKRTPEYIKEKILQGKAVIAFVNEKPVGFCYIETWQHDKFIANSGLVVDPEYRNAGLAKEIKKKAFELSLEKYPGAKIFGLTTSLAVMKINTELGYHPVTFSELTDDDKFWQGCTSCAYYDILVRTKRKNCLCSGMLYKPKV